MWHKKENSLYKKFEFDNFKLAIDFINKVALISAELNHHPKIINSYNVVELELTTHEKGKVTDKDNKLAEKIDDLTSNNVESKLLKIFTDGGSRGNPGPSATGIVIYDAKDNVVVEDGEYIGETTNNQAEYQAIKKAMGLAKNLGASEVEVYMDSELIIKQLKGEYKVKNQDLLPHYNAIKSLENYFDKVSYTHVLRDKNKAADAQVNKALDDHIAGIV